MSIAVFFLLSVFAIYLSIFFLQEKFIFWPQKLDKDYPYNFDRDFEEVNTKSYDGTLLNGLLFKTPDSKGLVFYLHGNGGCLRSWGEIAGTYTALNYDIFLLDYRGYGKSEGRIHSEKQLNLDTQVVYEQLKRRYAENKMVVIGYSLGAGLASILASRNNPKLLILQAPYYSITDIIIRRAYYAIPSFILKYKLKTYRHIQACKMPIVIFHGAQDKLIPASSSLRLKAHLKTGDRVVILDGQGHSKMNENKEYRAELERLLES